MGIRIVIDIGENSVIQYGWDIRTTHNTEPVKEPYCDIIGHSVNVAVKMTGLARSNNFVIGQAIYDILDQNQKSTFELLEVGLDVWSYINDKSGSLYNVYRNYKD
jgi:adenylate cyclase